MRPRFLDPPCPPWQQAPRRNSLGHILGPNAAYHELSARLDLFRTPTIDRVREDPIPFFLKDSDE